MGHTIQTQQRERKWNKNLIGAMGIDGAMKKVKGSREMDVHRMYYLYEIVRVDSSKDKIK